MLLYNDYDIEGRFVRYARGKVRDLYPSPSNKKKYLHSTTTKPMINSLTPQQKEIDCKSFYEMYKNNQCSYKNAINGYIAGYLEHYIIIGFTDNRGCIKSFNDHVTYDTSFVSYRLSKLKHITIVNNGKENIISYT